MPTALEKFKAVNNTHSLFWKKTAVIWAQDGDIVIIESEGYTFKNDKEEERKEVKDVM